MDDLGVLFATRTRRATANDRDETPIVKGRTFACVVASPLYARVEV